MEIQEQVPLSTLTTFGVGGNAEYYAKPATADELGEALSFAREHGLPVTVIGDGSNVLIHDSGIPGLVVHPRLIDREWSEPDAEHVRCVIGAGVAWDEFVAEAVTKAAWGVENLSGIPGSVGGSPIQNIGAYGSELADVLVWVEAVHISRGEKKLFSPDECEFGYRWSFFKTPPGKQWIVTRVSLRLSTLPRPRLAYRDLAEWFQSSEEEPTISQIREAVLEIRKRKFPDLAVSGTAGSFFTNPIISRRKLDELLARYPELPHYDVDAARVKVSAAWLLDKACGLKGYQQGKVRLFENQPLVMVAERGASASDIRAFSEHVQAVVEEETGVHLSREVRFLPEDSIV